MTKQILVFGSNTGGIHGGGAAAFANQKEGAVWGVGYGHTGNTFAIPTKGVHVIGDKVVIGNPLPLAEIQKYVEGFLQYARNRPDLEFKVTQIGCGLAGFRADEIAPMFGLAPSNCLFDSAWHPELGDDVRYWGTFR